MLGPMAVSLEHVLSLPELEQRMLGLWCVVHEPLTEAAMVEWLRALALYDDRGRVAGASELSTTLARLLEAGLLVGASDPRAHRPLYRVGEVRHALLAHLQGLGELARLTERVRE